MGKYILFFSLVSPVFVSAELMSVIVAILCLFMWGLSSWRVPSGLFSLVFPLLLIVLVGLHGVVGHPVYDVVKDVWYYGKPIPTIILGFLLAQNIKNVRSVLLIVILASVFSSLAHLYDVVFADLEASVADIRAEVGSGYYVSVVGLAIIIACHHYSIRFYNSWKLVALGAAIINFASLYYSFSRTLLGVFLLMMLILYGYLGKANWKAGLMLLVGVFLVVFIFPGGEMKTGDDKTFLDKIMGSLDEISVSDYTNQSDINAHWRGFEAHKAFKTYLNGDVTSYYVGQGFGAMIDLEMYMILGEQEFRFIPITHNAFPAILVKTGVLGLFLYLYFIWNVINRSRKLALSDDKSVLLISKILEGIAWSILMTTFVISGLYAKSELFPAVILIGVFCFFLVSDHRRHVVS